MLVLFTSETHIIDESEILNLLFEEGLERLHIRKPHHNEAEYEAIIKAIRTEFYPKIFLHEHHSLVEKYNLGGKHYRKKDNLIAKKETFKKSTGVHSIEELVAKEAEFNHLFVSPVFESISKTGYGPKNDLSIQHLPFQIRQKAIALGGIDLSNLENAKNKGYNHFAVLGAVWNNNPIVSFKRILEKTNE